MILVIVNVEKHTNRIYWFSSCNTNSYMSISLIPHQNNRFFHLKKLSL